MDNFDGKQWLRVLLILYKKAVRARTARLNCSFQDKEEESTPECEDTGKHRIAAETVGQTTRPDCQPKKRNNLDQKHHYVSIPNNPVHTRCVTAQDVAGCSIRLTVDVTE